MKSFWEIHRQEAEKYPFGLLTVGESERQIPVNRTRSFEEQEVLWVVSGSCEYRVDGEICLLQPGQGIFIRRHVPRYYFGEKLHTAWMTFFMADTALDIMGFPPRYMFFDVPDNLYADAEALSEYANGNGSMMGRSAAGYRFLTDLFELILGARESVWDMVRHLLIQRYSEPLTLDEIARCAGTNRFTLCREYQKQFGVTVMEDLLRIRMEKAKLLLHNGLEPVREIGHLCGFESPSYFASRFRSFTGMSPSEYRKMFV